MRIKLLYSEFYKYGGLKVCIQDSIASNQSLDTNNLLFIILHLGWGTVLNNAAIKIKEEKVLTNSFWKLYWGHPVLS